jgi:hypothetical protein
MKKLLQLSLLVSIYVCSVNVNAANLDWDATPSSATNKDFGLVLKSNADIDSASPFDFSWTFSDSSATPLPSFRATFTYNDIVNFTIDQIFYNGVEIATTAIFSFSSVFNTVNTIRIVGSTVGIGNELDVRIQATPIPAAVWLFG